MECIGLWQGKRWGEYFAMVATSVFVPYEIYDLTVKVTWLRLLAFSINLVLVLYLVWTKRLFGVRGGKKAYDAVAAQRFRDRGRAGRARRGPARAAGGARPPAPPAPAPPAPPGTPASPAPADHNGSAARPPIRPAKDRVPSDFVRASVKLSALRAVSSVLR